MTESNVDSYISEKSLSFSIQKCIFIFFLYLRILFLEIFFKNLEKKSPV